MQEKTVGLTLGGKEISILIRPSAKAKRMRLKIDRIRQCAVLVLNKRSSEKAGLDFAVKNAGWILQQLCTLPERKIFEDGCRFSLLGQDVVLHHSATAKRGVWLEENVVWVSGLPEHLPRRTVDFIKEEIRRYAKQKAVEIGQVLNVHPHRITVRDTTSRWGSCNRSGDISLSWRLAFAPRDVLDYVIIHEVCHLKQMNHSADFWKTVAGIIPQYKQMERWLKKNAAFLYSFGN